MKFITKRTFLLVIFITKALLLPLESKENLSNSNPIILENEQSTTNNLKSEKNKFDLIIDKAKDALNASNPVKPKGFNLDNLLTNLDVAYKLIRDFKEKTLNYTNDKKNLRSSIDYESELLLDYINKVEKIKNSLYNVDTSQISSINGKKINTSANLNFKELITKVSQNKQKLYYIDNLKFFDEHITILMLSILAGGLMGILVVACISIKPEDKMDERLYSKY